MSVGFPSAWSKDCPRGSSQKSPFPLHTCVFVGFGLACLFVCMVQSKFDVAVALIAPQANVPAWAGKHMASCDACQVRPKIRKGLPFGWSSR